jgi:HSP20 family protein
MLDINTMNPWDAVADLHRDLNAIVGRVIQAMEQSQTAGVLSPSTDLVRDEQGWKLSVAVPGIDPSKLDISVQGRTVTIRGERADGDGQEISNRFERQLTVPDDIDADRVAARYRHGLVELTLPVPESARPRHIQIEETPEVKRLKAA